MLLSAPEARQHDGPIEHPRQRDADREPPPEPLEVRDVLPAARVRVRLPHPRHLYGQTQ